MIVRPATPQDAAAIAEVQIVTWRAAYAGIVPQSHLDALDPAESAKRWAQHLADPEEGVTKRTVVATTSDGAVVGFATGGVARRAERVCSHELWAIYVRPDLQHRGAGTRLLAATLDWLASVGATSLEVLVLRDNHPGRAYYEGLGGVLQPAEASFVVGDVVLPERVYAWPALEVLQARCRARLHPEDVDAQRDAAYACDGDGDEVAAVGFYDRAWALGGPALDRVGFLLGYGSTLKNVGRLAESEAILRQALREAPGHRALPAFLALTLHAQGRHGEAVATLVEALVALSGHDEELAAYARALDSYAELLREAAGCQLLS